MIWFASTQTAASATTVSETDVELDITLTNLEIPVNREQIREMIKKLPSWGDSQIGFESFDLKIRMAKQAALDLIQQLVKAVEG